MKDLRFRSAEEVRIVVPSGDLEDLWYQLAYTQSVPSLPLSTFEVTRTCFQAWMARRICTFTSVALRPLYRIFLQILIFTASTCDKQGSIWSHIDVVALKLSLSNVDAHNAAGLDNKESHCANQRSLCFRLSLRKLGFRAFLRAHGGKNRLINQLTMKWIGNK